MMFLSLFVFSLIGQANATGGNGNYGRVDKVTSDVNASNDMMVVLCNVLNFVTGGIGKTIASFIIIGVGLGFFTGKVSWGVLIGVTLGISAMFGAPAIIRAITGGSVMCSKPGN